MLEVDAIDIFMGLDLREFFGNWLERIRILLSFVLFFFFTSQMELSAHTGERFFSRRNMKNITCGGATFGI